MKPNGNRINQWDMLLSRLYNSKSLKIMCVKVVVLKYIHSVVIATWLASFGGCKHAIW